jgi:methionine-gamma-lyase
MAAHGKRALALSEQLQNSDVDVCYPGLTQHPDRPLFDRLRCPDHGYGGVLTIDMRDQASANRLMSLLQNKYRFGFMAVSLGYFDTLMSCSSSSTSSELPNEDQAEAGIKPGLVRMSVGYTGTIEQRWRQLGRALEELGVSIG